jgi:hypothetical protein
MLKLSILVDAKMNVSKMDGSQFKCTYFFETEAKAHTKNIATHAHKQDTPTLKHHNTKDVFGFWMEWSGMEWFRSVPFHPIPFHFMWVFG